MIAATFTLVLLLALGAGVLSRRGSKKEISDYLVGGRSFGPVLVFILGAGEAYSIGTLIGFPGGVYAHGGKLRRLVHRIHLACLPDRILLCALSLAGRQAVTTR